jgi:Uma2 family endonuclease
MALMSAALQNPDAMTLEAFLTWEAPPNVQWQLVDGVPVAMAPASPVHGSIQNELGRLIGNHLASQGGQCRAYANPGVRLGEDSDTNFRIPDLGVSCAPLVPGDPTLPDPVLLIEILSPSNPRETWINVWAYTTIPSVQEILVVRSDVIGAQILRRTPAGTWPVVPDPVNDAVDLRSIGLQLPLDTIYVGTWLAAHAT